LVEDENVFPTKSSAFYSCPADSNVVLFTDQPFHPSFPATIKNIYRQLLRVFAHIYHAHFNQVLHLRAEPHFNSLFAHFLAFGREYDLLDVRDIKGETNNPVGVGALWERWRQSGILEA
jgi:MOB kinase activator 1